MGIGDLPAREVERRYADSASRFMELGEARVHYKDEGREGAPVLLLLHGTFSSLHTWDGWVDRLRDHYRMVRLDIPGFGLTGPPRGGRFTIEWMVGFIDDFTEELGLERFHVAGNSLGGYFAWRYAAERPGKVDRLVLVDAAGYPMPLPPILKFIATPVLGSSYRVLSPRFLVEANVRQVYGDARRIRDHVVERYHLLMLREGNRRTLKENLPHLSRFEDSRRVRDVRAPTLVMWGEEDRWISPSMARRFMRDLPQARLVTYPGVGHVPMEEVPERTADDAHAFLSGSADLARQAGSEKERE